MAQDDALLLSEQLAYYRARAQEYDATAIPGGDGRAVSVDAVLERDWQRYLGIDNADIFGYSDGGIVALGIAIQHPELVRKLIVAGTNYNNDGLYPEILEFLIPVCEESNPAHGNFSAAKGGPDGRSYSYS